MLRDLNLLVLRCRDLEASRRFYECFGLVFVSEKHENGPDHYASADEQGVLELYPAKPGAAVEAVGLGFVTADLEVMAGRLRSAGFEPQPVREGIWPPSFVVRDPDLRRVETTLYKAGVTHPDVEPLSEAEILRRVAESDSGNAKHIPWEEVKQMLEAKAKEKSK